MRHLIGFHEVYGDPPAVGYSLLLKHFWRAIGEYLPAPYFRSPYKPEMLQVSYSIPHRISEETATLVLSPHFDDAVLSLGGLLASHPSQATVATFFTKPTRFVLKTHWDSLRNNHLAMEVRAAENTLALQSLGVAGLNFSYDDGQYRAPDTTQEIQKGITNDLQTLLSTYGDRKVFIYGPALYTSMIVNRDHSILHRAFVQVARDYGSYKNLNFFLYEDLPYARAFLQRYRRPIIEFLKQTDRISISPEVVFPSSAQINAKFSALRYYVSQLRAFKMNHRDLEREAREFVNTRSVFGPAEIVYRISREQST